MRTAEDFWVRLGAKNFLQTVICGVLSIILMAPLVRADELASPAADAKVGANCCRTRDPGAFILPADKFFGETAAAYAAAKEIPMTCCKLFCYCGCDHVHKHTSLLQCFVTDHTADCSTCASEVFDALRMSKEGKTLAEIQKHIDQTYRPREYDPLFKPSPILQQYWKHKLWTESAPAGKSHN
ncbi:MAG TPA: CYCXC family (seleno)protein [Planktothrix sp.]